MSENQTPKTGTVQNTTRWFFWISADFQKRLDEPKREYFDGGYRIVEFETSTGFLGRTVELPADDKPTRMGFMNYAIDQLVESQNTSRRNRGLTIMFTNADIFVKGFDCGRDEL